LIDKDLNHLLTILYTAPTDARFWPEALAGVTGMLDLNASAIVHTDLTCKANSVYLSQGVDPDLPRLYAQGYGNLDVYRPRFLRMPAERQGDLLMGDELCTLEEMENTDFYRDILLKGDIRLWCAVATVHHDHILENISLYHSWKHEPPGNDRLNLARTITPHLNNALRLRARLGRLEGLSRDLQTALDHADTGIVLFDERGKCAFINRAAKRVLDRNDGLLLSQDKLSATDPQERSLLEELVRRSTSVRSLKREIAAGTVRITRRQGSPLLLRIAPFPSEHLAGNSQFAGILLIGDPDRSGHLSVDTVRYAFGLTVAESRLALLLTRGKSIGEAAEENGVTIATARSQLKSVFSKTGTKRQSELVLLLSALPGGA